MIDLYAAGTSNGIRARIALEECGLTYKLHPIALEKGENKTPQFMALNPNAQIPVIVDEEPFAVDLVVRKHHRAVDLAVKLHGHVLRRGDRRWRCLRLRGRATGQQCGAYCCCKLGFAKLHLTPFDCSESFGNPVQRPRGGGIIGR